MSQDGVPDPRVRASDADRERIVEQLRQHTAEGRLTMEEFDGRMSAAYSAKTYGELAELTRDLPVDLGSRSRGGGGTPPWNQWPQSPSWRTPPTTLAGSTESTWQRGDAIGALIGAAMDFKMQGRQMRDQLRAQRHQQRLARRRGGSVVSAVVGWAFLSIMLTGIWFLSGITDSKGFGDFWPAWPIGIIGLLTLGKIMKQVTGGR